jgi:hypothetical protein
VKIICPGITEHGILVYYNNSALRSGPKDEVQRKSNFSISPDFYFLGAVPRIGTVHSLLPIDLISCPGASLFGSVGQRINAALCYYGTTVSDFR